MTEPRPAPSPGMPIPSKRGDEHLCASCADQPGSVLDREGRLLCPSCAAERGIDDVIEAP